MEGYVYAREPAELGDLRDLVRSETLFVPMGGELFWSDMAWFGEGTYHRTVDGLEAAANLRDYHFAVVDVGP